MAHLTTDKGFNAPLWRFFEEILSIPHGSKNEAALAEHIEGFARDRGLLSRRDKVGNLVITKPGTPGFEDHPGIVLQGHLDMVCEKNQETDFDFDKDPIRPLIEGDWLKADGTTLGADNGIGIAAIMAVLDSGELEHPPIEALMTVDEESGLLGAMGLTPGLVSGRRLINLDSEEEGIFYFGCAGGRNTSGSRSLTRIPAPAGSRGVRLRVEGLSGGHSGGEIHRRLGNAVQLGCLAILTAEVGSLGVVSLQGGGKHNAIPREFEARLALAPADIPALKQSAARIAKEAAKLYTDEKSVVIICEELDEAPEKIIQGGDALVRGLLSMPHGVAEMSPIIHGMVETSTNLAAVNTEDKQIYILTSQRSSVGYKRDMMSQRVKAQLELMGCTVKSESEYPAWEPNPDSELLKFASGVYTEVTGNKAVLTAVHAGLECGVISSKIPGMDMVSFGPDLEGPHSPDERVSISSTERFWRFLTVLVSRL